MADLPLTPEQEAAVAHPRALYRGDPDQWEAFWGYAMAA